jgi:hypothetical protein
VNRGREAVNQPFVSTSSVASASMTRSAASVSSRDGRLGGSRASRDAA